MEIESILSAVSTVGFPIVCTGAMFYFWNKEREDHKLEMNDLKEVIVENTKVLEGLKQLIVDKL